MNGQDSEISPLIVEQITEQLQQRVLLEIQKLCEVKHERSVVSGSVVREGVQMNMDGDIREVMVPLTTQEESDVVHHLRLPPRLAKHGVYALLDLSDLAMTDANTLAGETSEEVRYSDVPILYLLPKTGVSLNPRQGNSDSEVESEAGPESDVVEVVGEGELTGYPLFKLNNRFLGPSAQQCKELLRGLLQLNSNIQQPPPQQPEMATTMIALCSPVHDIHRRLDKSPEDRNNVVHDVRAEATPGRGGEGLGDAVKLFIALWRLRLWNGMGWTVPLGLTTSAPTAIAVLDKKPKRDDLGRQARHAEETTGREEAAYKVQEQFKGQVVQGFQVVQGVMHGKWM
ncbi:hypothetical protein QFC24_005802 [Naganishia onofrii]|uniref:Uncharacterized protein n=1 Tax=Naganishia onofrii TaxID=1851511 RepID=A0ACC2X6P4_9TREE|nr:hypothetical protein QFC24_005802 [Naganishia onofrii]